MPSSALGTPAGAAPAPGAGAQQAAAAAAGNGAAASAPASQQAQQPRPSSLHKNTTLIPGWSRSLSSLQLQIECQKIVQPQRVALQRDSFGVLEMEVMKFVAYCGGVTVRFRVDDMQFGPADNVTWGLASTRPCQALLASQQQAQASPSSSSGAADSKGTAGAGPSAAAGSASSSGPAALTSPRGCLTGCNPTTPVSVDSHSRKPLYMVCSAAVPQALGLHDTLTVELAPREDKQPVIVATLRINNTVVVQQSLPCSQISSLQMYPFVTVQPGMAVSLHEAVTPSPLFTWYHPSGSNLADVTLAELDTCIKYHSQANAPAPLHNGSGVAVDYTGSATFSTGRHRWTVQLDNFSSTPTHVFVGVAQSSDSHAVPASSNNNVLSGVQGPLRSIAGTSSAAAAAAAAAGTSSPSTSIDRTGGASTSGTAGASTSAAAASTQPASPSTGFEDDSTVRRNTGDHAPRPLNKWGAWIRLPGARGGASAGALEVNAMVDWLCEILHLSRPHPLPSIHTRACTPQHATTLCVLHWTNS